MDKIEMNNMEKKEWTSELLSNIARLLILLPICGVPICCAVMYSSSVELISVIMEVVIFCLILAPVFSFILCIVALVLDHKNRMAVGIIILTVILVILFVVFWLLALEGMKSISSPPPPYLSEFG